MISKCQLFEFCLFEDIVERISAVNDGVWYYDVLPRFTAILSRKLGGVPAELAGGFCLGLNIGIINILLCFGLTHKYSVCCLNYEIHFIFVHSAIPIYIELTGNWP